jgi:hypothetical protein
VTEILETSVGDFEVDWYVGPAGTAIALDRDAGQADRPWIIDVGSQEDVAAALVKIGVPATEAQSASAGLWERRWRGPRAVAANMPPATRIPVTNFSWLTKIVRAGALLWALALLAIGIVFDAVTIMIFALVWLAGLIAIEFHFRRKLRQLRRTAIQ